MPTTFVSTMFVVITTLNGAGQLAPVDKADLPTPFNLSGPIFWSVDQCMLARGRMADPEKYVCEVFVGPKETEWTYQKAGSTGSPIAPGAAQQRSEADPSGDTGKAADPPLTPQVVKLQAYLDRPRPWMAEATFQDVRVGPNVLEEKDRPTGLEPEVQVKQQRRVTQRHAPDEPMLEGNPLRRLAGLFGGSW
jgi:hypothetical protein